MIFNKNNNGARELNLLTGNYSASNQFHLIASDVMAAESELRRKVGDTLFQSVETRYNSEECQLLTPTNFGAQTGIDLLVVKVQRAVATLAVFNYFQANGVAHKDGGRRLDIGENERTPWEWMLERDDRKAYDKYCRALDDLYSYLEATANADWLATDMRATATESLIKSLEEFERVYPIDHSYSFYFAIQPIVVELQDRSIRRMLGAKWADITAATVADADKPLLRMVKRCLPLLAVRTAAERWSLSVFPTGVVRRFISEYRGNEASYTVSTTDLRAYLSQLRSQAEDILELIRRELNEVDKEYTEDNIYPKNDPQNKFFSV